MFTKLLNAVIARALRTEPEGASNRAFIRVAVLCTYAGEAFSGGSSPYPLARFVLETLLRAGER